MSPAVYLVTGANRGIGYSFIEELAKRPDTIIFAGVRSYPLPADHPLSQLAAKSPETIFPIKITSGQEEDNAAAAEQVKAKVGKVDVIIANAGGSVGRNTILEVTTADMRTDFESNTLGPLVLHQSFVPLLQAANTAQAGSAKLVYISTAVAQITEGGPVPYDSYGASKAAGNYIVKKIDQEFPDVIAFPIHPGIVTTETVIEAAGVKDAGFSLEKYGAISPAQSVSAMLAIIDGATKETHGGKFWNYKGEQMAY